MKSWCKPLPMTSMGPPSNWLVAVSSKSLCWRTTEIGTSMRCYKQCHVRTRMVILNTPHNPTGTACPPGFLDALAEHLEGTDTLVLQRRGLRSHRTRRPS